ncbi:hypothetical protein C7402_10642 [Paraburkholderia unamae]|uniref:Uncharacterized protein n=1 Tax=Paraburkholderia unamae TaxID=219649 RepID=A0ABX5KN63_9BURK|nr:hypothetical protein C7402_10642 [Paraburkholderia unamae]RAR63785.1 hypothetical protein C7401_10542 [Paraburkholderia unamae]
MRQRCSEDNLIKRLHGREPGDFCSGPRSYRKSSVITTALSSRALNVSGALLRIAARIDRRGLDRSYVDPRVIRARYAERGTGNTSFIVVPSRCAAKCSRGAPLIGCAPSLIPRTAVARFARQVRLPPAMIQTARFSMLRDERGPTAIGLTRSGTPWRRCTKARSTISTTESARRSRTDRRRHATDGDSTKDASEITRLAAREGKMTLLRGTGYRDAANAFEMTRVVL